MISFVWLLVAVPALAQTVTKTAGASLITSSTLKLAKSYTGSGFFSGFDFFTDADPTSGYVDYVSQSAASAAGLVDVQADGSFLMRADSTNIASGRGRKSIRISSKDKFADGVYILDLNHMPVGCGTWPAFWTVTQSGWPVGGEIDVIEGANAPPVTYGAAYNATPGYTPTSYLGKNTASLHTSDNCQLSPSYMTGQLGSTVCNAYVTGNIGCGAAMGNTSTYGVDSYGSGFNQVGGWYAMWRDVANSGGVYVYYWPRNSQSVPDDVRNPNTLTTNVADWGEPGANLSVPTCKSDFNNHVIVFDLTFCGDYAGATYTASGCPSSCNSFVMNNPGAFAEAYWSINSLRVYNTSGGPVYDWGLSKGAIAGIAVGSAAGLAIIIALIWRYRSRRRRRQEEEIPRSYVFVARDGKNPRPPLLDGSASLYGSRPATVFDRPATLYGETPAGFYESQNGSEEPLQPSEPGKYRKLSRTSMQPKTPRASIAGPISTTRPARAPSASSPAATRPSSMVRKPSNWSADSRKGSVAEPSGRRPSTAWAG